MRGKLALLLGASLIGTSFFTPATPEAASAEIPHVLIWHGTYGFRHPVIQESNTIMEDLATETGAFTVVPSVVARWREGRAAERATWAGGRSWTGRPPRCPVRRPAAAPD